MTFIAEYVWLDCNFGFRSKSKVIYSNITMNINDFEVWNYDGSSTGQAEGKDSEVLIHPRAIFKDPTRLNGVIIFCSTHKPDGTCLDSNNYNFAKEIFDQDTDHHPWFGLEQEYFLISPETLKPLGFPKNGYPEPQFQYYCSVGNDNVFGRQIIEEHMNACINANIKISGINTEVAPGQWEFQIGPCEGIDAANHLWVARYLLVKITEKYRLTVNFEPKPIKGEWNGSGCHANYSTQNMREGLGDKTGIEFIDEAIKKLSLKHDEHMKVYGEHNDERMTGAHETASYEKFSFGRANRGASVRIGNETIDNNKGYFEDRRPASNCDPYLVTAMIFKTTCLDN
jgi:glutamine synthetase